ncbi:lipocalin [Austrofundulus limnaeus]|uniref:Lipocalin n=1 Tax=Austrofundulus limnaeus TaxID=52670 RepID=A0A2I4C7U6_AUSLI|nr:PREDICTED: lipocalin-like [Austrofundulus limnaeus]
MTSLLTLLGAVLCSLAVSSEVLPQADFNIQGMSGKWYLIGIASNSQWLVRRRATMKMGTAMLKPTANGDLEMSYASLTSDGSCWRKNKLAKKTDVAGKFTYSCEHSGALKDMRVTEVKSDEYALVHIIKKKEAETTTVTKLYGRADELGADVKQKFRQLALQTGTLPENIIFLPKNAECPAA